MPVSALEIVQLRCIERANLALDLRCNVLYGSNGSGKTSLLEACFMLGSGRSFRTRETSHLIKRGHESFTVVGQIPSSVGEQVLGVRGYVDSKEYRVAGQSVKSAAELANRLAVQVIDPEVHRLIEDGPARRRQFLDWGVFHVEPHFHSLWTRYARALRQRNAALRSKKRDTAEWDRELVESGSRLGQLREAYIRGLEPHIQPVAEKLLSERVALELYSGWKADLSLREALDASRQRDLQRSFTGVGPHRADLRIGIAGADARRLVSRGQQKLLACVLLLAQQIHRAEIGAAQTCLLLDDPAAELDVDNLGKLMKVVADLPVQLLVTGLSENIISHLPPARVFHVEHGTVRRVA